MTMIEINKSPPNNTIVFLAYLVEMIPILDEAFIDLRVRVNIILSY